MWASVRRIFRLAAKSQGALVAACCLSIKREVLALVSTNAGKRHHPHQI